MVTTDFPTQITELIKLKDHPTVALAPMAGITDLPFRNLCRSMGADYAISEMVASKKELWQSLKSSTRHADKSEAEPRIVQLIGTDPATLAEAAVWQYEQGANAIDLNMGCPAKKVCDVAAGSALLAYPEKTAGIFKHVVESVPIPVTVKIRTGTDLQNRNAVQIAQIAQDHGVQLVTIHGRTRADKFNGSAEYDTIQQVKQAIQIPVIANGDINTPKQAEFVLKYTDCDGIMIGRAAQGNPWVFKDIQHHLNGGADNPLPLPSMAEVQNTILQHIQSLHKLYGATQGVRIARKHFGWYCQTLTVKHHLDSEETTKLRKNFNQLECTEAQLETINNFFRQIIL